MISFFLYLSYQASHYKPQGDKGSGRTYTPSAMPARLADRYPQPQ